MRKLIFIPIICSFALACANKPQKETTAQGIIPVIKNYDYKKLQTRDYDQMLTLVRNRIEKADEILTDTQDTNSEKQGENNALVILKNAMTLILSRPNTGNENMTSKLSPLVRRELNNFDAYYRTMDVIVSAALNNLIKEDVPNKFKVSSTFILENAMSELRPEIKTSEYVKKIFVKIRDTKVYLPRKVVSERLLQTMHSCNTPSQVAHQILKDEFPEEKK